MTVLIVPALCGMNASPSWMKVLFRNGASDGSQKMQSTFGADALGSSISPRRHAHAGFEDPVEMALVEEPAGRRHIARSLALPQQPGCGPEAPVEEIGMGRQPGLLGEGANEMAAGQPRQFGEAREIRFLAHMRIEIIAHPQDARRSVADARQGIEIGPAGNQATQEVDEPGVLL